MPVAVKLPKKLEDNLGDDGAIEFIAFINTMMDDQKGDIIQECELRFENKLTKEISGLRSEFKEHNANLKSELKEDIANLKSEIKEDLANLKSEFKEDLANLKSEFKEDIVNLKSEIKEDIANLKSDLEIKITQSEARLEIKIGNVKTDLIKWFIGIAFAQIAILIAVLSFIVK